MERAGQKTRDIQFYSQKNERILILHSRITKAYAKYLEEQPWVISYEVGVLLEQSMYAHMSTVGIRGTYFDATWVSDFLLHFADGRSGIRELVLSDSLRKQSIVEQLEFSRRYWAVTDVSDWKVVLLEEGVSK